MTVASRVAWALSASLLVPLGLGGITLAQDPPRKEPPPPAERKSSFAPVVVDEPFESVRQRMTAAKAGLLQKHSALLAERYDLSNRPAGDATMFRGKAVQAGVRAKLPAGVTWESLAGMTPEQIRERNAFPLGFLPLPHPNHPEGGMLFPQFHIDEIKRDEQRDLQRFDLDFDLPDHFLPEFPAADLPDHAHRPRRRLAGQARHHRQLLRAVQRHPEPQAARRPAPAADAVPAAAVQPDRGPAHGAAEPRRRLPRLPLERPHQRVHAPDRRHPAAGDPPPHRHPEPARRQHPAPVRLAAGAEDGGGLHRVRAARRLLRRRSRDRRPRRA